MSGTDGASVPSRPPNAAARAAALAVYTAVALWLFRGAVGNAEVPGVPTGEQWGRVFVSAQVARWLTGAAPVGHADLLAAPTGMAFWPVDPLAQLLGAPIALTLGPVTSLTLTAVALCALSGAGPALLARRLGASRAGALAAGLVTQLAPFLLRNRMDMVLEADAVGVMALAAVTLVDARAAPAVGTLLRAGLGVFALAATSPYYAVYLALGCAMWAPFDRKVARAWAAIAAVGALACAAAAAPLLWTETGPSGRLSAAHDGVGYSLVPSPVVVPGAPPDARSTAQRTPRAFARGVPPPRHAGPGDGPGPGGPSLLTRLAGPLLRWPGGFAASIACLVALARPEARRFALLALAFLVGGPGPMLLARFAAVRAPVPQAPLLALLDAVPMLDTLGNPTRMLAAWIMAAAVAGGIAARGWLVAGGLALAATLEALAASPDLRVPSGPAPAAPALLAALEGPTVVFPSGDPPTWHPSVGPKEALTVAALAGVPVAYDYGRGRVPADVGLQLALATAGAVPVGETALRSGSASWAPSGFRSVLVLEDRLSPDQKDAVRAALATHGDLRAEDGSGSVWRLDE